MGGGGHMTGGARGFSGGGYHGGYAGGYRGYGGVVARGGYGGYVGYGHGYGYGGYGRGWYGYPYRGWGYGYGRWGYPWWGWGVGLAWYPGWGWGWGWDDSSYDSYNSYPADNYASTYTAPQYPSYVYVTPPDYSENDQTQDQISQLQSEVNELKAQQSQGKGTGLDTTLVFRDGHRETVQNYAIVGKTLWVFNETRAKKVPLSELDLSATKRDNEDRGVEFNIPSSR